MGLLATAPSVPALAIDPTIDPFTPMPQTWVNLRDLPSSDSHDQAFLLCEVDEQTWVAWVPDYGELWLDRGQFYRV